VVDAVGNVALWLEDGDVAARGVAPSLRAVLQQHFADAVQRQVANSFVPLVADDSGNVCLWLENGKLAAKGLAPNLIAQIVPSEETQLPVATDGRSLYLWRSKLAKLERTGIGIARILLTGDSWMEYAPIGQQASDVLHDRFGKSGEGWINLRSNSYQLNGVTLISSGWTVYDASAGTASVLGCGPDGHAFYTTGAEASIAIGNCRATDFTIYFRQADGTFRYRVDGADWTSVTGDGSNAVGSITISGLSDVAHALEIDTIGNAGTAVIFGVRAASTNSGVEVLKVGNAGLIGPDIPLFSDQIALYAADLAPDVVVVALGTNDYRNHSSSPAAYIAGLQALVQAYRLARPYVGFVFIAPADTNGEQVIPLTEYRDALFQFCRKNGFEFYNMHADFSSHSAMNTLGMWEDDLHLNSDGAHFLVRRLMSQILEL